MKNSPIGPLDRALGIAFGVVRGLVIVGLAYLAFTYFVPIRQQPDWLTEARTLPLMQSTAEVLLSLVPNQDHARSSPRPSPARMTSLGDLIRRNRMSRPKCRQHHAQHQAIPAKKAEKSLWRQGPPRARQPFRDDGNGGSGKP